MEEEERGPVGGGPGAQGRNGAGRGRRSPEQTQAIRRARLLDAAIAVLGESGVSGATIAALSGHAGISRSGFYETFPSATECLLAAHRKALGHLTDAVSTGFAVETQWDRGVVAGLAALLDLLDTDPQLARVLLVHAPTLGEAAQAQRREKLAELHDLLDATAKQAATSATHTLRAEAAVGAVAEVLRARAHTKPPTPYTPLLAELAEVVLVQYQTPHQQRETARKRATAIIKQHAVKPPTPTKTPPPHRRAPINERAHRMNDAILHIHANPGASNQQVAKGIGVPHLGQISRLLNRLHEQGLLRKHAGRPGHPNAWWLTPAGERYAQTLQEEAT